MFLSDKLQITSNNYVKPFATTGILIINPLKGYHSDSLPGHGRYDQSPAAGQHDPSIASGSQEGKLPELTDILSNESVKQWWLMMAKVADPATNLNV